MKLWPYAVLKILSPVQAYQDLKVYGLSHFSNTPYLKKTDKYVGILFLVPYSRNTGYDVFDLNTLFGTSDG